MFEETAEEYNPTPPVTDYPIQALNPWLQVPNTRVFLELSTATGPLPLLFPLLTSRPLVPRPSFPSLPFSVFHVLSSLLPPFPSLPRYRFAPPLPSLIITLEFHRRNHRQVGLRTFRTKCAAHSRKLQNVVLRRPFEGGGSRLTRVVTCPC
jgi:hypothetical protein